MSTEENKKIVIDYQLAVANFLKSGESSTGGKRSFQDYLAVDVCWHLPKSMKAYGGKKFTGVDGIERMLKDNIHIFYKPETIEVDFRSMIADGNFVHIHMGMSAVSASGKAYSNDYQMLFEIMDKKITNVWEYFDAHHLIEVLKG
jgi:ketosteroid isomerase-like protein